jgi:Zn finger protein HypA/HybF involved in hydrogenase expression
MIREVECPECDSVFESDIFEFESSCPKCGKKFIWDSQYNEVEGDWFYPDWNI